MEQHLREHPDRMPQLDGLRAFAAGAVMLLHLHPAGLVPRVIPLAAGVDLFFVISGFLITGILLRGRRSAGFVGCFYAHRALRLFPLYYLVLALVAIGFVDVRQSWSYYAFYGVNFLVAQTQRWGSATHFWTLGVEEQFYLLWPIAVLWLPRRMLQQLCVVLIVIATIFRSASVVIFDNPFGALLLPGEMDALACGALVALRGPFPLTLPRVVVALACAALAELFWRLGGDFAATVGVHAALLPCFVMLVGGAACGVHGVLGQILSNSVIRYLGRISYGLYVIHYPLAIFLLRHLGGMDPYLQAGFIAVATISLAATSWHYFEAPIIRARDQIVDAVVSAFSRHLRRHSR